MVKNRLIVLGLVLLFFAEVGNAQVNRYMVFFKDKLGNEYTTSAPQDFLSTRAIDRRNRQGISVTEQDLPVTESYVDGVRTAGANPFFRTKWMNGVLVQCAPALVTTLQSLPYVDHVEFVAPNERLNAGRRKVTYRSKGSKAGEVTQAQLDLNGIDEMHREGIHGENMIIALFDAGFAGVDATQPFQHILSEGRINLTVSQDFVFNSDDIFQYDDHGTEVFSVIAAYQEGVFIGGAYKAMYQLYVTEDASTEYRVEEYNWLFAAERADSAGVDVVNASLGYYDFDDQSMNYPKEAMDGKTTVVTRAAQLLADRGVVVVCSAGNEGNISWKIVSAPADAEDVLAVGSVDQNGVRASSSSMGPTADHRIKPDVMAMGSATAVIRANGSTGTTSGTSLASPLITSLVTGVWQKYPDLTNREVISVIRKSATLANNPNYYMGYGIPTFESINSYLEQIEKNPFDVFPNSFTDTITIQPFSPALVSNCTVELISAEGKLFMKDEIAFTREKPVFLANLSSLASGTYMLQLEWNGRKYTHRIVKR
jgi:subtilisin family serine protease